MASDDESQGTRAPESAAAFRAAVADAVENARAVVDDGPYDPEWDSLSEHDAAPEWFRDAKFGLYCHWGVYSVPAYDTEWYPHWMYKTDPEQGDREGLGWSDPVYPHHVETYGEPDEYPYQAFVPDFGAEEFDPDAWADLFERTGARFAGLTAEHHDGWSNWDSAVNPWNAGDRGPERDLVGAFGRAVRDRGLKFVTSFHHARTRQYYEFAYENFPSVTEGYPDRVMYGDVDDFDDLWLAKLAEVIDAHEPDLIYHDGTLPTISEDHRRRYLAHYFNAAAGTDRDPVVTAKNRELPLDVSVEDFERGRPNEKLDRAWLTDDSVTEQGWCHVESAEDDLKSPRTVIHELVDVVSKNGCLVLNFGPRADGTIPEGQREVLLAVGDWLDTHGEAIFETRPWDVFGEGPTRIEEGGHFLDEPTYSPEDVRYTRSKDGETVYALVMGWPEGALELESVEVTGDGTVELLGHGTVGHDVDADGRLTIRVPDLAAEERPSDVAVAFALDGFEFR
ncbi:MAG: alpha-L-fucosidase [Haloferacaceae archaeon]